MHNNNLSAAAALKAQMNESSEQAPPMVQKGTKRTAEEAGVDDDNDGENDEILIKQCRG